MFGKVSGGSGATGGFVKLIGCIEFICNFSRSFETSKTTETASTVIEILIRKPLRIAEKEPMAGFRAIGCRSPGAIQCNMRAKWL
jgi:hypothetical protein